MLGGAAAFRERLSILQAVGAALALFGVLQIISKGNLEVLLGLQFTAGDLWVAVGTVAWAAITALFFGIDRANWT
jgi:drug/metabolite transporter (DMT)-like permease